MLDHQLQLDFNGESGTKLQEANEDEQMKRKEAKWTFPFMPNTIDLSIAAHHC